MNDRTVSQAAQTQENVSNPFRMGNSVQTSGGALVSVEQQRAIAEVQARMIIARANPRDPIKCMDQILQDCTRPTLAEGALYQYARGGTSISGPSIRLAESIARRWGNIASGIKEISREDGYSECVAYAWDLETGYYDERQFQIRHWRDTKSGGYKITDERDIYELLANMGQRRKRAVLLTVMPGDVVEAAVDQCERTLNTSADTSPEALKKIAEAFAFFNVTQEQIEKRCQCRLEAIRAAQVVQLRKIYASLKDGMSAPGDWFEGAPTAASVVAAADADKGKSATDKAKATSDKPKPSTDKPIADAPAQDRAGDRRDARSDVRDAGAPSSQATATQQDRAPTQQDGPSTQHVQQQPATETAEAFFPSDDTGEPAELPGGADALTTPRAFTDWMADALDKTIRPDALWENNLDALEDLKARFIDMHRELRDHYADAVRRAQEPAPPETTDEPPAPDEAAGAPQDAQDDGPAAVPVPNAANGRPDWTKYGRACLDAIKALNTQVEVSRWVSTNFETFQGKAIATKIEPAVKARRQEIDAAKRPVMETTDQRGAPAAQEVDREAETAARFLEDIGKITTLDAHALFSESGVYKVKMDRWAREKPDLEDRVAAALRARREILVQRMQP